ncbi:hypothetical protein LX36DRAFT_307016 [Colletotrichum falcatum]|nr:hypothetical protein LX36DRAFT_307016 [Colletotrichum falcatum]
MLGAWHPSKPLPVLPQTAQLGHCGDRGTRRRCGRTLPLVRRLGFAGELSEATTGAAGRSPPILFFSGCQSSASFLQGLSGLASLGVGPRWEWAREWSILLVLRCSVLQERSAAVPPPPCVDEVSAGWTGDPLLPLPNVLDHLRKWRPPGHIPAIKQKGWENLRRKSMGLVSPALDSEVGQW